MTAEPTTIAIELGESKTVSLTTGERVSVVLAGTITIPVTVGRRGLYRISANVVPMGEHRGKTAVSLAQLE